MADPYKTDVVGAIILAVLTPVVTLFSAYAWARSWFEILHRIFMGVWTNQKW